MGEDSRERAERQGRLTESKQELTAGLRGRDPRVPAHRRVDVRQGALGGEQVVSLFQHRCIPCICTTRESCIAWKDGRGVESCAWCVVGWSECTTRSLNLLTPRRDKPNSGAAVQRHISCMTAEQWSRAVCRLRGACSLPRTACMGSVGRRRGVVRTPTSARPVLSRPSTVRSWLALSTPSIHPSPTFLPSYLSSIHPSFPPPSATDVLQAPPG